MDLKWESMALTVDEAVVGKENFSTLWGLLWRKVILMVQRSRSKWLKEGHANFDTVFQLCRWGRFGWRTLVVL